VVEQRSREQSAVSRQIQAWAPAVALVAGALLLTVRSELDVRLLRDALQALAYGGFTFAAVDAVERVLRGLVGSRPHRPDGAAGCGTGNDVLLPQARDGSHPLSASEGT
jgi:hypothetical protein